MELTRSGRVLVVTLLFRLLFGGYLAGMDQYGFKDTGSTVSVLAIYGLIGVFAALFLLGSRYGLKGIIGFEATFIIIQSVFIIATLSKIIDPGLHDPLTNWWVILLMYLFSSMTIMFSLKAYRENYGLRVQSHALPIHA